MIAAFGDVIRSLKPSSDTRSVIDKLSQVDFTCHSASDLSSVIGLLSQVVCEVAAVAWPRVWPNFLSDMCACGAQGESQLNVVLLVLHGVSLHSVSPNIDPGSNKMSLKQVTVMFILSQTRITLFVAGNGR